MAEGGWLGITMPTEYGGSGLGVTEAAIMMNEVAQHGGGMAAISTVHINLFGPHPIIVYGTAEQKKRWMPRLVSGQDQFCFGVTEPDAGLDTTHIKTFAKKVPGGYVVSGQKIWTSTAQVASKILLLTRTTPLEECKKPTDGMTVFYTDLDRSKIAVTRIPKMGRKAVDSNSIFIDDLFIPGGRPHRRGGQGLPLPAAQPQSRAHPRRIRSHRHRSGCAATRQPLCAASASCSAGTIGKNQAIQHPLAENWIELEAGVRDGDEGGVAVRQRSALRRRSQCRQVPRRTCRATAPARTPSSPTAAWATPRNTTSSGCSAKWS